LLSAELGVSRISVGDDNPSGLLARINATRRISASSAITLGIARQTADSADIIRAGSGAQRPGDAPVLVASRDPFVDRTVSLGWEFARPRTRLGVDIYRTQERYLVNALRDRTLQGGGAYFERRLRPSLSFDLAARYQREDLDGVSSDSKDIEASAGLSWHAGAHTRVSLLAQRYDRKGSGSVSDYTENRVGLQVGYNLLHSGR
jgi:hypothetical protein